MTGNQRAWLPALQRQLMKAIQRFHGPPVSARPHALPLGALGEISEAASHRYGALLDGLLAWARPPGPRLPSSRAAGGRAAVAAVAVASAAAAAAPMAVVVAMHLGPLLWASRRSSRWQCGSQLSIRLLCAQPLLPLPWQLHRSPPPTRMTWMHLWLSPLPSPPRRRPSGAQRIVPSATLVIGPRTSPRQTATATCVFAFEALPQVLPQRRRCCSRPLPLPLHSCPEVEVSRVACYRD